MPVYTDLGIQNHLCSVRGLDLEYCESYVIPPSAPSSSQTLDKIGDFMARQDLRMPDTVESALNLYLSLTNYFSSNDAQ